MWRYWPRSRSACRCWRGASGARWRVLAAGFTAAAAAVAAGVWISGGWTKFVEYGFTAKGKFLATGLPLSATVAQFLDGMREAPSWTYQLRLLYSFLALGFGIACLVLVAAACWRARGAQRLEMNFVACFAAAAALTLYPISDLSHLAYAIPVLLLAAVIAATRLGLRQRWAPPRRCSGSCRQLCGSPYRRFSSPPPARWR